MEIKLSRMDRVFRPGEKVHGEVFIHGKGAPLAHEGISLVGEGSASLQLSAKSVVRQQRSQPPAARLGIGQSGLRRHHGRPMVPTAAAQGLFEAFYSTPCCHRAYWYVPAGSTRSWFNSLPQGLFEAFYSTIKPVQLFEH